MKNFITTLLAIFVLLFSFGQSAEGMISYTVDISTDDPNMEMMISMFSGSTMTTYFQDDKARVEMDMGIVKNTTITDKGALQTLTLMEGMMGNKAMKTEMDTTTSIEEEELTFEVEYLDDEKEILGYTCKKAIVKDGEGNELIFWYTEDITDQSLNEKVKGVPLQFETLQGALHMSFTATELKTELTDLDENFFSTEVPEGYDLISEEELKAMSGGM